MALENINDSLPEDLKSQVLDGEAVHHFEYIPFESAGCGNSGGQTSGNDFIMISNKRILYEGTVVEKVNNDTTTKKDSGTIPLEKVSFVKTSSEQASSGCSGTTEAHILNVNSGGGNINISIPTKEASVRAKTIIEQLIL